MGISLSSVTCFSAHTVESSIKYLVRLFEWTVCDIAKIPNRRLFCLSRSRRHSWEGSIGGGSEFMDGTQHFGGESPMTKGEGFTCLLPTFSALQMFLRASFITDILTILTVFWEDLKFYQTKDHSLETTRGGKDADYGNSHQLFQLLLTLCVKC